MGIFSKVKSLRRAPLFLPFIFAVLLVVPDRTFAATIDFSPQGASYSVGQTFPVRIRVSSPDQAMNAASGVISFPEDILEATSISKADSIVSLWVQEPSYSNANGTVNFEGIVLNPGFIGNTGRLITVTFRAKARGQATISFVSSSVLANDGKGTNIITGTGSATYSIGTAAPAEADAESGERGPLVTSPTHPDQTKWYSAKDAELKWVLPDGVTGVQILLDKFPRSTPTVSYDEPFASKRIENIDDGLWYFHIRVKKGGVWGPATHYRLQIDAEKPRFFDLAEKVRADLTDPRATFAVASADVVSGIDHYEFQLDSSDAPIESWKDDGSGLYTLKPLPPGKHLLYGKVFDRAGNFLAASAEFSVKGLSAPSITNYPDRVEERQPFTVEGVSKYPDARVKLLFVDGKETTTMEGGSTDSSGAFSAHVGDTLKRGSYKVAAVIVDGRGAESDPSEFVRISVAENVFFRIGSLTVTFLTLFIPLLSLLVLALLVIWYGWQKFRSFRRRLRKEVREAEGVLEKTFELLREDIREELRLLERVKTRRQLTQEEERIVKTFKRHLDESEKYLQKEIEDIENLKWK